MKFLNLMNSVRPATNSAELHECGTYFGAASARLESIKRRLPACRHPPHLHFLHFGRSPKSSSHCPSQFCCLCADRAYFRPIWLFPAEECLLSARMTIFTKIQQMNLEVGIPYFLYLWGCPTRIDNKLKLIDCTCTLDILNWGRQIQ